MFFFTALGDSFVTEFALHRMPSYMHSFAHIECHLPYIYIFKCAFQYKIKFDKENYSYCMHEIDKLSAEFLQTKIVSNTCLKHNVKSVQILILIQRNFIVNPAILRMVTSTSIEH